MSAEKYSYYMDILDKEPSSVAQGEILLRAARDGEITTAELVRLDNWFKKRMKEKGVKHT